jgi:hypothetical protein
MPLGIKYTLFLEQQEVVIVAFHSFGLTPQLSKLMFMLFILQYGGFFLSLELMFKLLHFVGLFACKHEASNPTSSF